MEEESAGTAWSNAIENSSNSMTIEDKQILKSLGKLLGKTDIDGQISQIEIVETFINTQIEKAENEKNKNSKMYKTLGVVLGLVIVIILV